MEAKFFEVRDRATFLPVLAVCLNDPGTDGERYLLRRCGYEPANQNIMLTRLSGETSASGDPYHWDDRTMATAHLYIYEHWDELVPGQVVCCEAIRGERAEPKVSERFGG